jgi:anion-transporting  ArsA/GET3 family ATPase
MLELLDDPAVTGLAVVTTPEEMPVNESVELIERVQTQTHVDVAAVIVNRVLPDVLDERGREVFERLQRPAAQALLTEATGPKLATVMEATRLALARRDLAAGHAAALADRIGAGIPLLHVPELFTRATGRRAVQQVAEHLGGA